MAKNSLTDLVLAAVARSKKGTAVNSEIRQFVLKKNPSANASTIDTILHKASKEGLLKRKSAIGTGLGNSKFEYQITNEALRRVRRAGLIDFYEPALSAPKKERIPHGALSETIIEAVEKKSRDMNELYSLVHAKFPTASRASVSNSLLRLSKLKLISKSKNPMTDSNVTSENSKFVYSKFGAKPADTMTAAEIRNAIRTIISKIANVRTETIGANTTLGAMCGPQQIVQVEAQVENMFKVTPNFPFTSRTSVQAIVEMLV